MRSFTGRPLASFSRPSHESADSHLRGGASRVESLLAVRHLRGRAVSGRSPAGYRHVRRSSLLDHYGIYILLFTFDYTIYTHLTMPSILAY